MIRLAIIASVCMAMTYGQNLRNPHRQEPLLQPANVQRAISSKLEHSDGLCSKELRAAYAERNNTDSAVNNEEEQSSDNIIRYLVFIIEKTLKTRNHVINRQANTGNQEEEGEEELEEEDLQQCTGVSINSHFVLTTTSCCTSCLSTFQSQETEGRIKGDSGVGERQGDINERRQNEPIKKEAQNQKPEKKEIVIVPKNSRLLMHSTKVKKIHIPPDCVNQKKSSEKGGKPNFEMHCPVILELKKSLDFGTVEPISLPAPTQRHNQERRRRRGETSDLSNQVIASIRKSTDSQGQFSFHCHTDISQMSTSECQDAIGAQLPQHVFCTRPSDGTGEKGSPLMAYSPPGEGRLEFNSAIGLLVKSECKKTKRHPKRRQHLEGNKEEEPVMKSEDHPARKRVTRENCDGIDIWVSLHDYIEWIVNVAFDGNNHPLD